MATFRIGIAHHGTSVDACVLDLPGCSATAPTREALLALVPLAISEHLLWLKRGGIFTAPQLFVDEVVRFLED